MFHMTTTTGEKTFQTSDSSNARVQHIRMYWRILLCGSSLSVPTDLMDRIDKISPQPEVLNRETRSPWYLQHLVLILSFPNVCIRNA
ncbi:hypothetical protein TNCV_1614371 [Trichonephila clavipes]|nr:hypothetical protein TNCV_1614371 [Trichonephila clavipes]